LRSTNHFASESEMICVYLDMQEYVFRVLARNDLCFSSSKAVDIIKKIKNVILEIENEITNFDLNNNFYKSGMHKTANP
jgi:hypothetical protein